MHSDFDSIPLDCDNDPDDTVLTQSISSFRPTKSNKKYSMGHDCDNEEGLFPRKTNGSIAPSIEEERAIRRSQLESVKPKPRITVREAFDDEALEDVLDYRQGSSSSIAPVVDNADDVEINKLPKEKPTRKEKKSKVHRGESLSTEHAIEFMIKERQAMDEEYATLRRENEELKSKMSAQQHISPNKGSGAQSTPVVVEKIVERLVVDPDGSKWKEDAKRLRAENEQLRKQHEETERMIQRQRELAKEAKKRRLSQLAPQDHQESDIGEVSSTDPQIPSTQHLQIRPSSKKSSQSQQRLEEKSDSDPETPDIYDDEYHSGSESSNSSSEENMPKARSGGNHSDQFTSIRSESQTSIKLGKGKNSKNGSTTLGRDDTAGGRQKSGRNVPKLNLSLMTAADPPPPQKQQQVNYAPASSSSAVTNKRAVDSTYSALPLLLWKGAILWKIPYNGRGLPERRLVMIKRATQPGPRAKPVQVLSAAATQGASAPVAYIIYPPTLIWANPDKPDDLSNARELSLYEGAHLVEGHQSPAFWKSKSRGNPLPPEKLCFSVVTSTRSLDLAAESVHDANAWKTALHTLLVIMSSNKDWAIDHLHRDKPTWHHESLENPPADYVRKKREEQKLEADALSRRSARPEEVDPRVDAAYREASATARTHPNMSLKDQMFRATRSGDYHLLQNILRTKISVNLMEPENKDTPLMIACRAGFDDIAKLCLHYGARNDPHPDFGQTALHCAVEGRAHKCAKVLLEAAAPSQANVIISNLKDASDKTPLHISAAFGDTKMSKLLISHGAALHNRDNNQKTPLHMCAANGHRECLSFLLDHEGDSYLDNPDSQGNTALHYAAAQGQYACAKLLLETAANPIARNSKGQTPYNLANARGHQPICQLLLEYNDPETMQRAHSQSVDSYSRLERNATFPQQGGADMGLPRPHTATRAVSGGMMVSTTLMPPTGYGGVGLPSTGQLMYVDPAMMIQPMSARAVSTGSSFAFAGQGGASYGNFTARDSRPSSLFQGLQLNNPLTSRPSVGSDSSRQRTSSYDHLSTQQHTHSYSPIATGSFFGTSAAASADQRGTHSGIGSHQTLSRQEHSADDYTATKPLESFDYANRSWVVYESEGYPYYLVEATQHSQWEDPRHHGVLVYNEATGEYDAEDLPVLSDTQRVSPKAGRGESTDPGKSRGGMSSDGEIPEVESHYRSPAKKGSQTRSKTSKPLRITADAEDVSPDGKNGRFWSGSEGDDSIEEISSGPGRSRSRGGKVVGGGRRRAGGERAHSGSHGDDDEIEAEEMVGRRGRQPQRRKQYSDDDSLELEDGGDVDELDDINTSGMEQRHGPGSFIKTGTRAGSSGARSSSRASGGDDTLSADDVDAMQFGNDIKKLKMGAKSTRVAQGGAFADAEDPQFLLDGPEEASEALDGYDDDTNGLKTNCFSPDKASLHRALHLQRSFSPKSRLGSPGNSDSDPGMMALQKGKKKSKKGTDKEERTKGDKNSRSTAFSDEEDMDYSRPRKTNEVDTSTAYSDEDEEEEDVAGDSADEINASDWDAESETDDKRKQTRTGNLGNIEQAIKGQSTKKPNKGKSREHKYKPVTPPENLDETKLKKGKLFVAEQGGYGNGGNTFDLPPLESETKPVAKSAFPTLKPGGSGFVSPRPVSQPQLDDAEMEARILPYIEMLKQGVPCLTVKNNMTKAGESRETIKMMLERADELSITSNMEIMRASSGGSASLESKSDKLSKEELAALKQDPEIGKYMKMHGMGVPVANILQKMELDQLSADAISRVKGYMGVKTEEENVSPRGDLRESFRRKSSVPMLKMHWNTLPPEKLQNSIFAGGKDEDSMQDEELEELEKLFGAQSKPEVETMQVVDKKMRLLVLDGKRAQNVVIGLAQFKAFESHDMLLSAVCAMDEAGGLLSGDRLQNLSQLIPSVPEARKIHGMEGSEHPAELFFLVANKYFPDLPKRLACFVTCCTFEESFSGVMAKMKKIVDACNEIISSDNLARVLQKMLTVGNLMNEGTYRGQASGFSLDSLLKMVHTKGVDKKTSVLDYVVKSLLDKADDAVMGVSEDLSFDDETARISGKDTGREVDAIQQGFAQLESAYSEARNKPSVSEAANAFTEPFVQRLGGFLDAHRAQVKEMTKTRQLMDRKIVIVVEYFGEDENVCDTTNIFSVLREFKMAFEHSRKALIARMERANRMGSSRSMGDENKSPRY